MSLSWPPSLIKSGPRPLTLTSCYFFQVSYPPVSKQDYFSIHVQFNTSFAASVNVFPSQHLCACTVVLLSPPHLQKKNQPPALFSLSSPRVSSSEAFPCIRQQRSPLTATILVCTVSSLPRGCVLPLLGFCFYPPDLSPKANTFDSSAPRLTKIPPPWSP